VEIKVRLWGNYRNVREIRLGEGGIIG